MNDEDSDVLSERQRIKEGDWPVTTKGTEFELDADLIIATTGQGADLEDLRKLNQDRNLINVDRDLLDKNFVCGDVSRLYLLTTSICCGQTEAESVARYLQYGNISRQSKVSTHYWNLRASLLMHSKKPDLFPHKVTWMTNTVAFAVHNYEDRLAQAVITADQIRLAHFNLTSAVTST